MRALLLDPTALRRFADGVDPDLTGQTLLALEADLVREVDYTGDFRNIYTHLTFEGGRKVDDFNGVPFSDGRNTEMLWVDGEALLFPVEFWITISSYSQPLGGRGLLLRTDHEGESVASQFEPGFVLKNAAFGWRNLTYRKGVGLEVNDCHALHHWQKSLPWPIQF